MRGPGKRSLCRERGSELGEVQFAIFCELSGLNPARSASLKGGGGLLRPLRGDRRIHGGQQIDIVRLDIVRLELFISNLIETWILEELRLELGKNKSKGGNIRRFWNLDS